MMKKIEAQHAPAAIGPYSQAIVTRNMLYASGQIPIDPATGELVAGDVSAQAEQVMKNIDAVLKAAGTELGQVVKTTCYLTDMQNFAAFNAVYEKYFVTKPARSCVAVKELPKNALVEVEVQALMP